MAELNQDQIGQRQTSSTLVPEVVEARTDDSANPLVPEFVEAKPKTCHQCRQMRTNLVGSCVTQKKHTTCPLKFCTRCIFNRYEEDPEEVALKTDWVCPRCRGDCNCSLCMKKRGKKPTGNLVHIAKANGCSSAAELLKTEVSEKYFYKKRVKPEEGAASVASPTILDQENAAVEKSTPKKIKISDSVHEAGGTKKVSAQGKETTAEDTNIAGKLTRTKPALKRKEEKQAEVKLPQGNSSITVAGIDLAPEDVGNVLQFLEFCSAFGKALDLRKEQAESVISEMFSGRSNTTQQNSTLTQIIIKLLTVILKGKGETSVCLKANDASWFNAVGKCLSASGVKLDDFPPEMFEKDISEYEKLASSKKLRLLNFLCDETLGTSLMRKCIRSQHNEYVRKTKEPKENIISAKEKKLQDEVAKAIAEKNGIPLTITEHDAIVSPMSAEMEEVHSELKSAIEAQKNQGSDNALRINPVEVDDSGLIFWKLKSYNDEQNILLQDLGSSDQNGGVCPQEKWVSFSSEQNPEIEKYISSIRMKRRQAKKNAKTIITSE